MAFGGIGLVLAGTLKPLVNLAVVNALFVVLLLLGGMLIPLAKLPTWLADLSRLLPAAALAQALHGTLGHGTSVAARDWVVLVVWAVGAPWWPASPSAGSRPRHRSAPGGQVPPTSLWIQRSSCGLGDRADDVADDRARLVDEERAGLAAQAVDAGRDRGGRRPGRPGR